MGKEMMFAVDIDAEPEAVYQAIVTEEGLRSFWTPSVEASPEVGTEARFRFQEAPIPLRMRVDRLEPGAEVRWTCVGDFPYWAGTEIVWRMERNPSGTGTRMTFSHTGWPDDQPEYEYATVNYTWGQIVARLHDVVPSGHTDPYLR